MQGNQRVYICEKHNEQKVMFVCAVNDWHFEPLCQLCTPAHTQNHAKRLKINFQSFQEIDKKVQQKQSVVSKSYEKQIEEIKEVLKDNQYENAPIIKDLKLIEQKIIQKIRSHFEELNKKTIQRLKILLDQNTQKLKQLQSNLQKQLNFIKQITKPQINLDTWKNSAKKIYFQDKLESYLQESKEIIDQYRQNKKQITESKKKQLFTDQNKFFASLISLITPQIKFIIGDLLNDQAPKPKQNPQNDKKSNIGPNEAIKKPHIKIKKKLCKNCNQQMEYLTQNKKHLICRYCNSKERNYVKKPI